jgi:hypothetical protein
MWAGANFCLTNTTATAIEVCSITIGQLTNKILIMADILVGNVVN